MVRRSARQAAVPEPCALKIPVGKGTCVRGTVLCRRSACIGRKGAAMVRTGKRPVTKAMAATPYDIPQGVTSLEEAAAHLLRKVPHTGARKRTHFERMEIYGSSRGEQRETA